MCQWLHDCAIMHPAKQQSVNAANQRDRDSERGRQRGSQLDWQPPKRLIYLSIQSTYLPIVSIHYIYNHSSVRRCVVLSICQHPVRFTFRDWFILYKMRLQSAYYAYLLCAVCQRVAAVPDTIRYDTIWYDMVRNDTIVELRPPVAQSRIQNGNAIFEKRTLCVCLPTRVISMLIKTGKTFCF